MARPEKVAVVEEIRTKLDGGRRRGAHRVPRAEGPRAGRAARRRCARPAPSTRSSRTRWPAGRSRRPGSTSITVAVRGPGGDRVRARATPPRAAKALRDFGQEQRRRWSLKGGLLGERVITPGDDRGAGRPAVPRGAPRPDRRRVPGAAGQGGRPVPGLHPQLRLRRQGADRPARRRRRGPPVDEPTPPPSAAADDAADARRRRPPKPSAAPPRPRRRRRGRSAPAAEADAPPPSRREPESAESE